MRNLNKNNIQIVIKSFILYYLLFHVTADGYYRFGTREGLSNSLGIFKVSTYKMLKITLNNRRCKM